MARVKKKNDRTNSSINTQTQSALDFVGTTWRGIMAGVQATVEQTNTKSKQCHAQALALKREWFGNPCQSRRLVVDME
jgi:hypothetical protein